MASATPPVAVIMGSQSDWSTMRHCVETLEALTVGYDARIVSAHRTPERMFDFARDAKGRGVKVIIAGAGGAAHLPGMTAALTTLPVFGVPPGRHAGHRPGRRGERRPARRLGAGALRPGAGRPPRGVARQPARCRGRGPGPR